METVENLFEIFKEKASRMLLFIQHLEVIEFWRWQDGQDSAECFYKVEVSGDTLGRKIRVQWLKDSLEAWTKRTGQDWKVTEGALQDALRSVSPASAPRQSLRMAMRISKPHIGWQDTQVGYMEFENELASHYVSVSLL